MECFFGCIDELSQFSVHRVPGLLQWFGAPAVALPYFLYDHKQLLAGGYRLLRSV